MFLPDGTSFALSLTSPSQPGGQLMRAKEGINYPLKGFALILKVSIWSLPLFGRTEQPQFERFLADLDFKSGGGLMHILDVDMPDRICVSQEDGKEFLHLETPQIIFSPEGQQGNIFSYILSFKRKQTNLNQQIVLNIYCYTS